MVIDGFGNELLIIEVDCPFIRIECLMIPNDSAALKEGPFFPQTSPKARIPLLRGPLPMKAP